MSYKNWQTDDVPSAADFNAMFSDAQVADVATSQSTTSTSYTNLATSGPTVFNVAMVAGQQAWVMLQCSAEISGGPGHAAQMGYLVTGAATQNPSTADSTETQDTAPASCVRICVFTAPVSGTYTFGARYQAVNGTTASFANRRIIVKKW